VLQHTTTWYISCPREDDRLLELPKARTHPASEQSFGASFRFNLIGPTLLQGTRAELDHS
jgi:hypothetical protein